MFCFHWLVTLCRGFTGWNLIHTVSSGWELEHWYGSNLHMLFLFDMMFCSGSPLVYVRSFKRVSKYVYKLCSSCKLKKTFFVLAGDERWSRKEWLELFCQQLFLTYLSNSCYKYMVLLHVQSHPKTKKNTSIKCSREKEVFFCEKKNSLVKKLRIIFLSVFGVECELRACKDFPGW